MEGISGPGRAWGVALKGRAGHSDRPELQSQSVFPRPPPPEGREGIEDGVVTPRAPEAVLSVLSFMLLPR